MSYKGFRKIHSNTRFLNKVLLASSFNFLHISLFLDNCPHRCSFSSFCNQCEIIQKIWAKGLSRCFHTYRPWTKTRSVCSYIKPLLSSVVHSVLIGEPSTFFLWRNLEFCRGGGGVCSICQILIDSIFYRYRYFPKSPYRYRYFPKTSYRYFSELP